MYETFFGLSERPFTLRPDPSFLYLSRQHSLALSMLEFALGGQAGFVVVTGEIGSGKTTLIRHFLRRDSREATIGVISNTHAGIGNILQWVLQAFKIETKLSQRSARYQYFIDYLTQQAAAGRQVVIIVDEAQNLSVPALEELRLLSNIETEGDHTLQIILVGQPELMAKLQQRALRQFAQRISVHYHLRSLSYLESRAYIRHRLAVAGSNEEIFDTWASAAIYYFAEGIPRIINSLCDMSLVYAYSAGAHVVDIDLVLSVIRDREKNGIQMLARRLGEISRRELIEMATRHFDQDEERAAVEHADGGPLAATVPPRTEVTQPITPHPATGTLEGKETVTVAWQNGQHAGAAIHWEKNGVLPPITAMHLSDDVYYQDGILREPKFGAVQWLRRHLHAPRRP